MGWGPTGNGLSESSRVETLRSVPHSTLVPLSVAGLSSDCLGIDIDLPLIGMTCANPLPIGCEIRTVGLFIGLTMT